MAIRSDGTKAPSTSIRTITEEQGKARVREFIEKNGLAKGTSIEEIRLSGFFGKALLAKVQLENGKQASVVISRLTEDIIGYEGDVKKSVYEEQTLPDDPNGAPSAQVKQP
ncbi:hypothetical protein N6H14_14015 [Paenibacillus sp. CC-CFT747]|nr:hypothetical protein N6H14_14015 [Paenibacillus sp. CC-CFT747]